MHGEMLRRMAEGDRDRRREKEQMAKAAQVRPEKGMKPSLSIPFEPLVVCDGSLSTRRQKASFRLSGWRVLVQPYDLHFKSSVFA